jgi:hypothetical protein
MSTYAEREEYTPELDLGGSWGRGCEVLRSYMLEKRDRVRNDMCQRRGECGLHQ